MVMDENQNKPSIVSEISQNQGSDGKQWLENITGSWYAMNDWNV